MDELIGYDAEVDPCPVCDHIHPAGGPHKGELERAEDDREMDEMVERMRESAERMERARAKGKRR